MAFTNQLTREKPGPIWVCAMDNRLRSSRLIREIRIDSSLLWPVILTGLTRSAEFSARSMAVRLSRKFSIATKIPAAPMSRSIRRIPISSMRRCGNHAKDHGKIALGMAPMAAFSNRPMAAKPGTNCARVFPDKIVQANLAIAPSSPKTLLATVRTPVDVEYFSIGRWRRILG